MSEETMVVKLSGHSDDVLCLSHEPDGEMADGWRCVMVGDNRRGVAVFAEYAPGDVVGVWRFSIEPVDQSVPMFPVSIVLDENGYSPEVHITCPVGTSITGAMEGRPGAGNPQAIALHKQLRAQGHEVTLEAVEEMLAAAPEVAS